MVGHDDARAVCQASVQVRADEQGLKGLEHRAVVLHRNRSISTRQPCASRDGRALPRSHDALQKLFEQTRQVYDE